MSDFAEFKGSAVWEHYLRSQDGHTAKCRLCKKVLKISGGSTKGLHVHLRSKHGGMSVAGPSRSGETPQNVSGEGQGESAKTTAPHLKGMKTLDCYYVSKTDDDLDAILARMCARDGIPFTVFCTSPDLRGLLAAKGYKNLPTHHNTIRRRVLKHCARLKCDVKAKLAEELSNGKRFSLTIDEYTSLKNRRYMSVTVHCEGNMWGLGVARCHGSMPAEKCLDLLQGKLAEFGLELSKHVTCVTTDGASVMVKFGKSLPCEHQLCFAHGVHLAVVDALYSGDAGQTSEQADDDRGGGGPNQVNSSDESDGDDEDEDDNVEENTTGATGHHELHSSLSPVVKSIRNIVRWFRKSPVRNEVLQKYSNGIASGNIIFLPAPDQSLHMQAEF
ncbi:uncharacterized protein LOC122375011 [Amphibalanus amphitrite]|uniref:uncharacterized protein LOC122375011 n=1 Tax=Amphibalanus amphitrite TaxID=1232801 RepID=UPI001C906762|nr:uncharacterized protein LOC122375011 [Amphibalanus amphitrite]